MDSIEAGTWGAKNEVVSCKTLEGITASCMSLAAT